MPLLPEINVPSGAVPAILVGYGYDPDRHGTTPADKEAFVRRRLIEHLKRIWKRGHLMEYNQAYITPEDPDIT